MALAPAMSCSGSTATSRAGRGWGRRAFFPCLGASASTESSKRAAWSYSGGQEKSMSPGTHPPIEMPNPFGCSASGVTWLWSDGQETSSATATPSLHVDNGMQKSADSFQNVGVSGHDCRCGSSSSSSCNGAPPSRPIRRKGLSSSPWWVRSESAHCSKPHRSSEGADESRLLPPKSMERPGSRRTSLLPSIMAAGPDGAVLQRHNACWTGGGSQNSANSKKVFLTTQVSAICSSNQRSMDNLPMTSDVFTQAYSATALRMLS